MNPSMAYHDGPKEVAARLRLLLEVHRHDYPTQGQFAHWVGVEKTALSNWISPTLPKPLPRDAAIKLCKKVSGLSLDWLYFGSEDGMSRGLLSRLREAEKSVMRVS
jgi:hypothetical protein